MSRQTLKPTVTVINPEKETLCPSGYQVFKHASLQDLQGNIFPFKCYSSVIEALAVKSQVIPWYPHRSRTELMPGNFSPDLHMHVWACTYTIDKMVVKLLQWSWITDWEDMQIKNIRSNPKTWETLLFLFILLFSSELKDRGQISKKKFWLCEKEKQWCWFHLDDMLQKPEACPCEECFEGKMSKQKLLYPAK